MVSISHFQSVSGISILNSNLHIIIQLWHVISPNLCCVLDRLYGLIQRSRYQFKKYRNLGNKMALQTAGNVG